MHELGSIDVMRLDQTLGQSRRVACASSCMSMRTSLEEGIQPHRFAAIFPEQFLTEAGGYSEAVVAADQRMVIRCYRDDIAGFVPRCFSCDASNPTRSVPAFMLSPEWKSGHRRDSRPDRRRCQSR